MAFHLHIENFRCLRKVDLDLGGVCVLIGPNGSGKSTFVRALQFMSDVLSPGPAEAFENAGGGGMLQNFSSDERILLRASQDDVMWEVLPRPKGIGVQLPMEERFSIEGKTVIEQLSNSATFRFGEKAFASDVRLSLYQAAVAVFGKGEDEPISLLPSPFFVTRLQSQSYFEPDILAIRQSGSPVGRDTRLNAHGKNVFTVLRNWKAGNRIHEERFSFVREGLRRAFPDLFDALDFESAGQIVTARFYMPGNGSPIPFHLAPTGLIAGLLHLTAVASTGTASTVMIDEFENSLHPHAIRVLIDYIRERAAKMDLTVLLASHSPVVLDQFRDCPAQAIVMDPSNQPTPLDKLEDPNWLAQFSLGDLYAHENIGAAKSAP